MALAVTLTAVSNIVSLAATPLSVAAVFEWLLQNQVSTRPSIVAVAQLLLLGLVLPIAAGMLIRRLAPEWTQHYRHRLQRLSLIALAALILFILIDQAAVLASGLGQIVMATLLFTAISFSVGYAIAAALWRESQARAAVAVGFCDRNLSTAIMLAASVLGRMDFVAFSALFFLIQAALLFPVVLWLRRRHSGRLSALLR